MWDGKYAFEKSKIIQGDCREKMKLISDGSIDMIFSDLPYGTTKNKWNSVIPLDELWLQYKRVIKENGAIVLTENKLHRLYLGHWLSSFIDQMLIRCTSALLPIT